MATWRKTSYTEFINERGPGASPRFKFAQDGSSCTRTLDVNWTGAFQAVKDFLGYSFTAVGGGGGKSIVRQTPHYIDGWVTQDGAPFLFATQISDMVGIGKASDGSYIDVVDVAKYAKARLTVQYETLPYDILSDGEMRGRGYVDASGNPDESTMRRYVMKNMKPKAQYLSLPRGSMKWVTGTQAGKEVGFQPGKIVTNHDVVLSWYQVPDDAIPSSFFNFNTLSGQTIESTLGKVNSAVFAGDAIATLLFTAADIKPRRSPLGNRTFDVEYHMDYAPNTQVKMPNLSTATAIAFIELSVDGNTNLVNQTAGANIYDYADFTKLLKVGT